MVRPFIGKVLKDNVTMLASVVAWGVLSSIIPILVGLIAISGLLLRDPVKQRIIIASLSQALQHVLTAADLRALVYLVVNHAGLLGLLGIVGMLWGASNIGGAIATVFQPIFQVRGLLFFVIYAVFPNIEHRFRVGHIWQGAGIAALLFQVLSYIWPLYVVLFHPQRYGAVLAPIVILGVWIYFFALILVLGAEVVAFGALADAKAAGQPLGPRPDGTVPQRMEMSEEPLERPVQHPHAVRS